MNHEEEKRCPLCTEEMDWTDLQFNPCKCGYQVCVWCWHHIIDIAEKDETEGRCPACRTIYDKEKVSLMQTRCESQTRTKVTSRKTKPPRAKQNGNEVKKDLTNVRVIQRKMAYVIGLPLSLANEEVLNRKEYFGQYGKVSKVSLSRTSGGVVQQFINDTCSVYVTYSKEEEALRCIQSVHGFCLEGKLLRASFGTAKYCHTWLKNAPCNNPSCLYLHNLGADEDSFGKDEVAAVHTRNRVEKIVGSANNMTKRSGNLLPPPADVHSITSSVTNKSTVRSGILDVDYGYLNGSSERTCIFPSKDTDGTVAVPQRMTTFVDIVGRPKTTVSGKDENATSEGRIQNLCSDLSSVTINENICVGEIFSGAIPSPDNTCCDVLKDDAVELHRKYSLLSHNQGSRDTYGSSALEYFVHPSYSTDTLEDSCSLDKNRESHWQSDFDPYPGYNSEDEAILPVRCVNSVLDDSCQQLEFPDKIHSSLSFSNQEILEHLRRIDDNVACYEDNSVFNAVESSIISNLMSIDFDSKKDPLTRPISLSELFDETDGFHGSSWSSLNSDQSGYSDVPFASQTAWSILPEYGDNRERYSLISQNSVAGAKGSRQPGFSISPGDPPPGFSTIERNGCLSHASSVADSYLANASPYFDSPFQATSARMNSRIPDVDFFDPTPTGQLGFEVSQTGAAQVCGFEECSNPWLKMQQSPSTHQEAKFPSIFPLLFPFQELSRAGASSEIGNDHDAYDPSLLSKTSQQKENHENSRYIFNFDEAQRQNIVERKERLGSEMMYIPGRGDLMYSSTSIGL